MVGCFSWCRGSHKVSSKVELGPVIRSKSSKKVSAVPTTSDYVLEGTSEALKVLNQAVSVVGGVPGAQEVLQLALTLIQTCQDLTEIEEKVSELKDQIESIMLVMVAGVTGKKEEAIPQDLIKDIEKLGTDLEMIKQDLDKIAAQSWFLVALFRAANKAKVDRCMELLKNSLTHWEVARDISQGVVLHEIQQGIGRMQKDLVAMRESMGILNRRAHTANHASSRQMPTKPTIFYGRDAFVTDIVNILVSTTTDSKPPRICIHGPGGMGKTSTALAVMEDPEILKKFDENDRFWVPCICATSPDLLLQILYNNLRISLDTGDFLADIITELRSSSNPRLMLLDNFETPWDPIEGREDVENILNRLSALSQLSILVTMRTNIPPSEQIVWVSRPLGTVDAKTSHDIYCAIHPTAKGKPKLGKLLAELGHMPFAIMLVAQLGKTSKSMPSTLLKDWRKDGPGMLSPDGEKEDSISRSIALSMNSKTMVKNVPARTLLATLPMLPAGTTHSRLDLWAPQLDNMRAAISALSNVALIVDTELPADDSEASISVLPVVQSYMQRCDRISPALRDTVRDAAYGFVLEHKSSPGDLRFKDNLAALSTEETNIQSILLEATRNADAMAAVPDIEKGLEVLVAFSWYQHWTKPRTEVIDYGLKLARNAQLGQYIAEFLFCLGSTFFRLDRYEDACRSYIEAQSYFRKLPNIVRASECAFELVDAYLYMGQDDDAKQALYSVSEEDLGVDGYLRACRKMAYGDYYSYLRMDHEALETLNAAKEAFETEEINRPVDAASCLCQISRTLMYLGRIPEAVKAVDQSLDIYERYGPENSLVDTLLIKNGILLSIEASFDKVLPILERTLQKGQDLGAPLSISQALEFLGELHARERKVSTAIEYYKAAAVEYETISTAANVRRCQNNYNQLALMENNLEAIWNGRRLSSVLLGR